MGIRKMVYWIKSISNFILTLHKKQTQNTQNTFLNPIFYNKKYEKEEI